MEKQILSQKTTKMLCCVLQDELIVYSDVIYRAENLNWAAKRESWSEIMNDCGFQSWKSLKEECIGLIRPRT